MCIDSLSSPWPIQTNDWSVIGQKRVSQETWLSYWCKRLRDNYNFFLPFKDKKSLTSYIFPKSNITNIVGIVGVQPDGGAEVGVGLRRFGQRHQQRKLFTKFSRIFFMYFTGFYSEATSIFQFFRNFVRLSLTLGIPASSKRKQKKIFEFFFT